MKNMFYIYRTSRESRGAVEVWVDVDGRGSRGARGEQHLQGSMRGEQGTEILNNILAPAIGWRSRSSFFLQFYSKIAFRSAKS